MDLDRDVESITALKRDAAGIIDRASRTGSPVVITQNGKAKAVVQDVKSFERQRRALMVLKLVAQGERDLEDRRVLSHARARKRFERRLAELARETEG